MDLVEEGEDWLDLFNKSAEGKLANYDQITDQIYLSGYKAPEILEVLQEVMKVSAILNVTDTLEPAFPEKFRYKVIEVSDEETSNI